MFTKCGLWTALLLSLAYCAFHFYVSNKDLEGTICTVKEHYLSRDNKHKYIVYNNKYGTLEITRNNNDLKIKDEIRLGPNCIYGNLFRFCDKVFITATLLLCILVFIILTGFFIYNEYILEDDYGYIYN